MVRAAGGGFAVAGAHTRFGAVDLAVRSSSVGGVGEDASAVLLFAPWAALFGANATPAFSLRLRGSAPGLALQAGSVTVSGDGVLLGVDSERVLVGLKGPGKASIQVTASLR